MASAKSGCFLLQSCNVSRWQPIEQANPARVGNSTGCLTFSVTCEPSLRVIVRSSSVHGSRSKYLRTAVHIEGLYAVGRPPFRVFGFFLFFDTPDALSGVFMLNLAP